MNKETHENSEEKNPRTKSSQQEFVMGKYNFSLPPIFFLFSLESEAIKKLLTH